MTLKTVKPIFLMILLTTLCSACGQKGPLYRTPAPDSNQPTTERTLPQVSEQLDQGKEG